MVLVILLLESSQFLEGSHAVVDSMNRYAQDNNYCLELRYRERLIKPKTTIPYVDKERKMEPEIFRKTSASEQETIQSHVHQLEKKNSELNRELDSLRFQLLSHQELKDRLSSLQNNYSELDDKCQEEQSSHKKVVQHLQEELDKMSLVRRKMKEHLSVLKETSLETNSKTLLEKIQEQYVEEVGNLTSELRVKDRSLQEMRNKRIALVRFIDLVSVIINVKCATKHYSNKFYAPPDL